MDNVIKELCDQLVAIVSEYSDCWSCGKVIQDPGLLVPDPVNPGNFRSLCPACGHETMKFPYPPIELRLVFDLMIESAERKRPILVLILACTVHEALMEGFFVRLLDRRHIGGDICDIVTDATNTSSKGRIIKSITGNKPKKLIKSVGYDWIPNTLLDIQKKRNKFLHSGIAKKEETKLAKIGQNQYHFTETIELDEEDIQQALQFTIDTINCFALLYSNYGQYVEADNQDY